MVHPSDDTHGHMPAQRLHQRGLLNVSALQQDDAPSPPSQTQIIKLLNDCLAAELVYMLDCKGHHFMALALGMPDIARQFLLQSDDKMTHAERLAFRIVELGGEADFSPEALIQDERHGCDHAQDLKALARAHLQSEHRAIETYTQIMELIGGCDPQTQRLLSHIVVDKHHHAHSMYGWCRRLGTAVVSSTEPAMRLLPIRTLNEQGTP